MDLKELYKREFLIGINIYEQTVIKSNKIWFTKLVEMLETDMDRSQVSKTLDHMFDCGMVKAHWEFDDGWLRCLTLASPYTDYFANIYESCRDFRYDAINSDEGMI